MSGRRTDTLHTFYRMDDGSCLAFFEAPDMPFEFKAQHDYDLHIALEVKHDDLLAMFEKGKRAGVETRGISDHGFIHSIYFRDPNGYVIELTAKRDDHERAMDPELNQARRTLADWQSRNDGGNRGLTPISRSAEAQRGLLAEASATVASGRA